MAEESIILQSGNITVTNLRFIVGRKTFAVHGITSIEGKEKPVKYSQAVIVALVGMIFIIGMLWTLAFVPYMIASGLTGIFIIAISIRMIIRQKGTFRIVLATASGQTAVYETKKVELVTEIVNAVNQAIVSRG